MLSFERFWINSSDRNEHPESIKHITIAINGLMAFIVLLLIRVFTIGNPMTNFYLYLLTFRFTNPLMSISNNHIIPFMTVAWLCVSCNSHNKGTWEISDVSKDTTLFAETEVKNSSRLILIITGETDDSIKVHQVKLGGGHLQDTLYLDWYNPLISISFESYQAKKGQLKIAYYLPGSR